MLNIIWVVLILSGILYSIFTGNTNQIGEIILNSSLDAFNLFFKVALLLIFWNGMFQIAINSGMIKRVSKILKPILVKLFPEIPYESEIFEYISAAIIANVLGLAAAATPLGLKAIEEMQKINTDKRKASRSMITLLLLNISSLTLFPSTIISLMHSFNSKSTNTLYLLLFVTTSIGTIFAIMLDKVFAWFYSRREKE
ncbi:MAG: spore maturation protein [Bacilli bacterium]|jgi:spore maturation protein A|nr:spore maturation protein [Acholeplasmataceae bacterium]